MTASEQPPSEPDAPSPDAVEGAAPADGRRAGLRGLVARVAALSGWRAHLLLIVVFTAFAAPFVAQQAASNSQISIFDEWQYVDRVHDVTTGDLMMDAGEPISRWGDRALYCRGIIRVVESTPAECSARKVTRIGTTNSAAADPPTYFWLTGAGAAVVKLLGITDDTVLAARLVGAAWAVLSMWTLFWLARLMGAGRGGAVVAASTVLLVPAFLQQYTYATPHSLDIPVGAFVVGATIQWVRRRWSWWPLVVGGLLVAGVKGTNVTVVVATSIALACLALWPNRSVERATRVRAVVGGLVLGVSSMAFTALWMWIVSARTVRETAPPGDYGVESLDRGALVVDSFRFLVNFGEGVLGAPSAWLLMAMTGAAIAVWSGLVPGLTEPVRQLAPGYLLGSALGAVLLDVLVFVSSGQYIGVQVRYALALFPLGLGFAALLLRTRTAIAIAGAALLVYALMPWLFELDPIAF